MSLQDREESKVGIVQQLLMGCCTFFEDGSMSSNIELMHFCDVVAGKKQENPNILKYK